MSWMHLTNITRSLYQSDQMPNEQIRPSIAGGKAKKKDEKLRELGDPNSLKNANAL